MVSWCSVFVTGLCGLSFGVYLATGTFWFAACHTHGIIMLWHDKPSHGICIIQEMLVPAPLASGVPFKVQQFLGRLDMTFECKCIRYRQISTQGYRVGSLVHEDMPKRLEELQ
eukprot:4452956-Amphidinium_carterae.1